MASRARDPRLEQAKPKEDSPVKAWKRKEPAGSTYKRGGFSAKDLPKGKITQNRAKPGMTTPE
jgi:hypothetical protein